MALILTVEILRFPPCSPRSEQMLEALGSAATQAGVTVACTDPYRGGSDLLILWGPGDPRRVEPIRQQLANGGHVLAIDLAYWNRHTKVRFSIDAAHPQAWVMRKDWPRTRFDADPPLVADAWQADGPIVIAGMGPKATVQYGGGVARWEADQIAACRRFNRPIVYRPKKAFCPSPPGVMRIEVGPIEDVLTGASLLITWHSNTAVDAIRLGIPAICRDGAAAAVCPSALPAFGSPQPLSAEARDRLLFNLAHFQWAPHEARQSWRWLTELLAC